MSTNPKPSIGISLEAWNRRLHYFLGLYFVLFIWLFSFTGLLLNHSRWRISAIPNAADPVYEQAIEPPSGTTDRVRAQNVISQLGLRGEIDWPASPQPQGRLNFNVVYPRLATQVRVDLGTMRATVRKIDRSMWPALTIAHSFSGSRYNAPATQRDWWVTSVWTLAMDALAIGLAMMVCGSYYMWYRLKPKRTLGVVALAAGWLTCAWFVFGLSWGG